MTDRMPPQNVEAEASVISAVLIDNSTLNDVLGILKPECFYRTAHQKIFAAICDLFACHEPADLVTLSNRLKETGQLEAVGGSAYLARIVDTAPLAVNAPHYARIVRDAAIGRHIIEIANVTAREAMDGCDVTEIIERAQHRIMGITVGTGYQIATMSDLCLAAVDRYENIDRSGRRITGIATGYHDLDWHTCGLQSGDLVILAARPSMGKSSLALCMARYVAGHGIAVGLFSLEMSKNQLTDAMIAQQAGIDRQILRRGGIGADDWPRITAAAGKIAEMPIYIDDDGDPDIGAIRQRARELRRRYNVGLVIIDHLQIVRCAGRRSRTDEIGEITRGAKAMAKELSCPVLLLSQLNRALEARANPSKRPVLSDLRDSGAIEQDADVVLFLYRPAVYGDECRWPDPNTSPAPFTGQAELSIAKHRNGPTGMVMLRWHPACTLFTQVRTQADRDADPFGG